jgi:hypothetical protein
MAIDTTTESFASLTVVNYEALANKDAAEIQKPATAGQTVGMWYVDLRGPRTQSYLEDVPVLFKPMQEFFSLPIDCEEKVKTLQDGKE